jgi:hypothetical protein
MFEIKLSGGTIIEVEFAHFPDAPDPGTDCFIFIRDSEGNMLDVFNGYTTLHPNDQYSRPFGRKLALTRAIQQAIPRRYTRVRKKIWDTYFEMNKGYL